MSRIPLANDPTDLRRAFQSARNTFFDESSDVDHDATTNFVAAEHVDHSAVSVLSGTGLTGGGTIESDRTLSLSHLGIEALTDPGADRILFWDDSATALKWLTVGANLTITDTTISAAAGSDTKVAIDSGATAGYLGAAANDGVLRTSTGLGYADGGDYVTLTLSHLGVEALTDPGADRIAFWDETANAFKWLTVGANLTITDTTIAAAAGVTDHGALTGLDPDDDHTQYFLASGTRDITGPFEFQPATHNFLFTHNSVSAGGNRCRMAIQGQTSGDQTFLDLYTKDGDASDNIGVVLWGMGQPDDNTNVELLNIRYNASESEYSIDTMAGGSGNLRTIAIYTEGNDGQFRIETSGGVTLKPAGHRFLFRDNSVTGGGNRGRLAIQCGSRAEQMFLDIFTADGDDTDYVGVTIWALGLPTNDTNSSGLATRYESDNTQFALYAFANGSGTQRPIAIYTEGNAGQILANVDGSVSMSGALGVTGNITGPNVTSGADPGHTHTSASLPDVESLTTSLTAGSVVFSDGNTLAQDNTNFFWDDGNDRLGVGTASPNLALQVHFSGTGVVAGFFATDVDTIGEEALIHIGGANTHSHYGVMIGSAPEVSSPGAQDHAFIVKCNDGTGTDHVEVFRVNAQGEVGIYHASSGVVTNAVGMFIEGKFRGTGRVTSTVAGFNATGTIESGAAAGTTTNLKAGNYKIVLNDADTIVTYAYGITIDAPTNAGTFTNTRGLWIADQTVGTQTNTPFAIYQQGSGDLNYLAGSVGIGDATPTAALDVNSDIIRLRTAKTPASSGAAGNQGDICWDASYIYVCTATNTWERAAIAVW